MRQHGHNSKESVLHRCRRDEVKEAFGQGERGAVTKLGKLEEEERVLLSVLCSQVQPSQHALQRPPLVFVITHRLRSKCAAQLKEDEMSIRPKTNQRVTNKLILR